MDDVMDGWMCGRERRRENVSMGGGGEQEWEREVGREIDF